MSLYAATQHAKNPAHVSDNDCGVGSGLFLKILGHIIYIIGQKFGVGLISWFACMVALYPCY